MKRNFKKGFTIVELVIVIAVIAILSAVLIPTFTGIVDNAKKTTALTDVQAIYKDIVLNEGVEGDEVFYVEHYYGYFFMIENGQVSDILMNKDKSKEATSWADAGVTDAVIAKLVSYESGSFDRNGITVKVAQA